jgi:PBS lyase HEAT-like repeat
LSRLLYRRNAPLLIFACLPIAVLFACVSCAGAQSCQDENFDVNAAVQKAWDSCSERAVYEIGAVGGERAISGLRKLAEDTAFEKRCAPVRDAAIVALAKLGDPAALQQLAREFDKGGRLTPLTFVGNDDAIAIMMAYFEAHRTEPLLTNEGDVVEHGRLLQIIEAIALDIGQRRAIPDLPTLVVRGTGDETKAVWEEWWEKHKSAPITVPPYQNVSDPHLRCLARMVDWGFPSAIFEIADTGGDEALSALRQFPSPTSMGLSTVPGDLTLALAKLGDRQKLAEVFSEWQSGSNFTDAIDKLTYIGGKDAAGLFVSRFDQVTEGMRSATVQRDACVARLFKARKLKPGRATDDYVHSSYCEQNYDNFMRLFRTELTELLDALSRMVKDPPLPAGAAPTLDNVQLWKDWWRKNKDTAQFVSVPVKQYE